MYYYWDPTYLLVIIGMLLCLAASAMVNSAMNEWQQSLIDSVTAETDEGGMKSVG